MFLITDKKGNPAQATRITPELKEKAKKGTLYVVNLKTMKHLSNDGEWHIVSTLAEDKVDKS